MSHVHGMYIFLNKMYLFLNKKYLFFNEMYLFLWMMYPISFDVEWDVTTDVTKYGK